MAGLPDRVRRAGDDVRDMTYHAVAERARDEILTNQIRPPSQKDGITLVETGDYVGDIGVYTDQGGTPYVGLPSGDHPASGVPYDQLWQWLRYGTATIPARPHIDTAIESANSRIPAFLRRMGFVVRGRGG